MKLLFGVSEVVLEEGDTELIRVEVDLCRELCSGEIDPLRVMVVYSQSS